MQAPLVRVIRIPLTDIISTFSPADHEHGYRNDGSNGKGWGPGGRPKGVFENDYLL